MATASDDFNRADGGLGANWTTLTTAGIAPGTLQIASNQATGSGGWSLSRYNAVTFGKNQRVGVTYNDAGGDWGVAARVVDVSNFITVAGNGSNGWVALEYVAGTPTIHGSGSTSGSGTAVLEVYDSTIRVWIDGALVLTVTTAITSVANPGVYCNSGAVDNWEAADVRLVTPIILTGAAVGRAAYI